MDKELNKQVEVLTENESEKKNTAKFSAIKMILAGLAVIVSVLLIAVAVVLFSPGIQMKFMTNYVMKNIRDYNWSALQMEDPVKPGLAEAFGKQNSNSIDVLYNYMKDAASEATWEIKEINKEDLTVTLDVEYTDRSEFLKEYAYGMGDYIVESLNSGTMELADMLKVLDLISDEDNTKILNAAMERINEKSQGVSDRKETTLTVNFEKNGPLCIPTGTSDEVNNVASAGLFENIDSMTSLVAVRIIPQVIDHVFLAIQTFDEEEIEKYTGSKISDFLNMEENDKLYLVLYEYLRACSAKMSYQVGEFDEKTGEIHVECSYLDSKDVISTFVKLLAKKSLENLFSMNPKQVDVADILRQATETPGEDLLTKTVVITFDTKNCSDFHISEEIYDVVSANLYSEMGELMKYLK